MKLAELKERLFTLPERPDWIPYRTSYFKEDWGFCMSHSQLMGLDEGDYEICIDSSLEDGRMNYGELLLKGESSDEVLISTHICHPSLCNDNLSGIAVAAHLAHLLRPLRLRYSYRFLFIPATLGSITWLCLNQERAEKIKHGLVLAGVGDSGKTTYKKSRRGDAAIDKAARYVLGASGEDYGVFDFVPYGYDERQYCSPAFNLPVGVLARTPHAQYAQYHTSADDLSFVQAPFLANSLLKCLSILNVLENNAVCVNQNPWCEPQLSRRGIFRSFSERAGNVDVEMALLWVLNYSDGHYSLLDIAERSGLTFDAIRLAADVLIEQQLLEERPAGKP
jgi:aminopeptidase-like protein